MAGLVMDDIRDVEYVVASKGLSDTPLALVQVKVAGGGGMNGRGLLI
jgi:hypothetical protein